MGGGWQGGVRQRKAILHHIHLSHILCTGHSLAVGPQAGRPHLSADRSPFSDTWPRITTPVKSQGWCEALMRQQITTYMPSIATRRTQA